jgi:hypothetical protein
MPLSAPVTEEESYVRIESLKQKLISIAISRKIAASPDELIVRDLLPQEDLGCPGETFTSAPIAKRVESNKIIGFYGVASPEGAPSDLSAVRFRTGPEGTKVINIYQFQQMFGNAFDFMGYFDEDIIYKNDDYMAIDFYASTSRIVLLGLVVEPKGETVNQNMITYFKIPNTIKENIKERLKNYLKDLAVKKGIVTSIDNIVVRDILPDVDLGFSSNNWNVNYSSIGWNTVVSIRIPNNKLIAFYGATNINNTESTSAIAFKVGAGGVKTKAISEITAYYTNADYREAIFSSPIVYENGDYLVIQAYTTNTGPYSILEGYVAEPKGETINPD